MIKILDKLIRWIKIIFSDGEVYYINGSETLPPPLEKEEEDKLFEEYLNGSIEARDKLIEHNLRLVVYVAKKYETNIVNLEDLISIGTIGLIKSISTFKQDKNIKLATYASRCIENEILMYLRKKSKMKAEISFDEPLNVDYDGNELLLSDIIASEDNYIVDEIENDEKKIEVFEAINELRERERQILVLRFGLENGEEMTQKDVADYLGISQSYISRLEKRIIKKLRTRLNKK
ncbi:MAG: RNA polymerase sporulation sigma factor SigK [Bacilli bacterium]|nr:RNA polymerase sporulation sigma factor SigK [Bacilli bacterium]